MSVNFVLTAFTTDFTAASALLPTFTASFTNDAIIDLSASVSATTLQNTFYFRTDNAITLDASFVYYYTDKSVWGSSQTDLNPKNGTLKIEDSGGAYVPGDNVSKDFIRNLAHQLFGTYLGADLFTNEDDMVSAINSACDGIAVAIQQKIADVDITSPIAGLDKDEFTNVYLKDDTSDNNITRELFNRVISDAPTRFVDLSGNFLKNATDDGFYRMPILTGDTITFQLTIKPNANQTTTIQTLEVGTVLVDRVYCVKLTVA